MRVDITKLETKIVTEIAGLKSDSKVTKWQINLLFGGATAVSTILFSNIRYSQSNSHTQVVVWLVKDYAEGHFSLKHQVDSTHEVSSELVADGGADAKRWFNIF